MSDPRGPDRRREAHRHPTVSAEAPGEAEIKIQGNWIARALFAFARACGLELVVVEVEFEDPAQTISDRLEVKKLIGETDPKEHPPEGAS